MGDPHYEWPASDDELIAYQYHLAALTEAAEPADIPERPITGGCFVAFARGEAGPGRAGDRAWAAAVAWRDGCLLGDAVVAQPVPARYTPGLLARREGPILGMAVAGLEIRPDVLLVDATGLDHPRGAGLAVHLGAVAEVPSVGVTHRLLAASGCLPRELSRGSRAPVHLGKRCVGYWVCTRTGVRAVVAHAGWRTSPETAAEIVLMASRKHARTPAPLREARRIARTARARAGAG